MCAAFKLKGKDMEQHESTISLTAPPDSNWGKVEQFVIDRGYFPVNISWREYIATIILHWEGCSEDRVSTEEELVLENWLAEFDGNYRMEDFDYE